MTDTVLAAEGLRKVYRLQRGLFGRTAEVVAVDDVSLALQRGRTLGLVGESGCGKSTTGRLVLGLERPDRGTVAIEGEAMPPSATADWRRLRARLQMVFQDPLGALDRRLTIGAQIREPLEIHGLGHPRERGERVIALLRAVGLREDHAERYPHELSGGQRQRAVLARALVTNPLVVVADEPISALDVSIQAQVMNLLLDLQDRFGIALLFISHDLRAVRQVSQRIAVMYLGRIVEEGEADAILRDPAHPYARALVSAIPRPGRALKRILLQGDPPNPADRPPGCAFHPRCPFAVARCRVEPPALMPRPDGRLVACHLVHDRPAAAALAA